MTFDRRLTLAYRGQVQPTFTFDQLLALAYRGEIYLLPRRAK